VIFHISFLYGLFSDNLAVIVLDFLILQDKHNIGTRYIVVEYEINLHSLRNRLENLAKGLIFYLFDGSGASNALIGP
jgi:hypothetical protein